MTGIDGGTLRAWRRSRGWDVPALAREMRKAAGNDPLPVHDALVRMIRRWEREGLNTRRAERYELLYAAVFSIEPERLQQKPGEAADAAGTGHRDVLKLGISAYAMMPHLSPGEQQHLTAALDDARRYLDKDMVGYFRGQLDRMKADDGSHGPSSALPPVLGILGAISHHVRDVRPRLRCPLLSLGADGAEFAGWLYRDLQDAASATYWYDRAMEWAQEAGDTAMQGYVLLKKSQMAYDQRDAFRVVTLAQAAGQRPGELPGKVRAEVLESEAIGLAMLGESLDAIERKHDEAASLLTGALPDDHDSGAGAYFTADTLLLRRGACYTEAGKPARAAMLFGDVIQRGALSRRDSGFFRARRAAALALSGEPDEAAAVGLQAVRIARETSSERTLRVLADVVGTLEPWHTRPGPQALKAALATSPQ